MLETTVGLLLIALAVILGLGLALALLAVIWALKFIIIFVVGLVLTFAPWIQRRLSKWRLVASLDLARAAPARLIVGITLLVWSVNMQQSKATLKISPLTTQQQHVAKVTKAARQEARASESAPDVSAIYGNWADPRTANGCSRLFFTWDDHSAGGYVWDPMMDRLHTPPNRFVVKARYVARDGAIIVIANFDEPGKTHFSALRLTPSGELQGLKLFKPDGSEIDVLNDKLSVPDLPSLKVGEPDGFILRRCGAESAAALTEFPEHAAVQKQERERMDSRAQGIIDLDLDARNFYNATWIERVQEKCTYIEKVEAGTANVKMIGALSGYTNLPFPDEERWGIEDLVEEDVRSAYCSSPNLKGRFFGLMEQMRR